MNLRAFIVVLSAATFLVGCSNSGGGAGASTITTGLTTVTQKLNNAAAVIQTNSSFTAPLMQSPVFGPRSTGLHTVWTTDPGVSNLYDGAQYSLKEWFTDEFNPSYVNNNGAKVTFVGRLANSMSLLCFLGGFSLPTDSTNLPSNGTYSVTITAAIAALCGDSEAAGSSATLTVTSTTDTTYYDKNFSVDMGDACPFKIKVRMNSAAINIATAEDQSCEGRDHASAAVILYNKTTDALRFTYHSQAFSGFPSGFEFYRGYYTGTADESYILGICSSDNGTPGAGGLNAHVAYSVVGKPTAGGTAAVSAKVLGNTIANNVYNGCVNSSTKAVTSASDTLVCTMTGVDVLASFNGVIVNTRAGASSIADLYNISESVDVGFTDNTDMF